MCQWTLATITSYWILLFLFATMCSCSVTKPVVEQEGTILAKEGDAYLCIFKELDAKPHTYAYMWVYQPGLGLIPVDELQVSILIRPKRR